MMEIQARRIAEALRRYNVPVQPECVTGHEWGVRAEGESYSNTYTTTASMPAEWRNVFLNNTSGTIR